MKIHIVQKGDTLWKIAKKYGVNFEELKKMNSQLSNPDMIMPGMKIKVPTSGGSVKKEAPMNLGAKKEMPKAEAPLVKEQPIVEAPIAQAPIKEAPVMPIKEAPIMPVKEAPKVTYTPKIPQPVIPDIDINNYYMLNMANMSVQQPQLPPKPTNILPEVKEVPKAVAPIQEVPKEIPQAVAPIAESPELPIQGGFEQPMYPEYCIPVSPILPGSGLQPGLYSPQPFVPYQQPVAMPYQPMPYQPMPYQAAPSAVNPAGMPGVSNPSYLAGMEESSSFMPQMPVMNPMGQNPTAVMGVQSPPYPQGQPMGIAPAGFGPVPVGPMADNCVPASPVLPGSGFGNVATPYGAPFGYPQQQPWPIRTQPMTQDDQQMPMQQMPFGGQQLPMQQMPFGGGQQMPMQQMPYD
ncbi:MAG TPA: SafA/ExsA family spore coat assembly protein, partial [Pseudoneobacillus sp.]|nr:SafA/ExsA family spore coat assembly protein [Pseudoneobacillus sp.]